MKKLTSRKFLVALGPIVTGIMLMLGYSETLAGVVAGAIVTLGSAITYMVVEYKLDAKSMGLIVEAVTDVVEAVDKETK